MDVETRVGHRWWGSSTAGSEEGRGPRPAEVGNQGSVENSRVEYVLLEGGLTTGPGRPRETLRAQGNRSVVTQAKMGSVDQHRPQLSVMVEICFPTAVDSLQWPHVAFSSETWPL